jgi:hypothetical protein
VEGVFPFANVSTTDPITHRTAGRLDRCAATKTCPRSVEIYSGNEYWVKAASLMHTDPTGMRDLPDSPYSRIYFVSGHPHVAGSIDTRGACQQRQNPLDSAPVQRALFVALDEWVTMGTPPPVSLVPRLDTGTLVRPSTTGFPQIPGVTYNGLATTRYLFDYGPTFYRTGIATKNPPTVMPPYQDNPANGPIYPSFVPKTDADGNDIAGVRLPDVAVPLGTYTGWALRSGPQAGDGCEAAGQFIPFAKTAAERKASGDPRLSLEERYASLAAYVTRVRVAVDDLVSRRLLLREDAASAVTRLTEMARTLGVSEAPMGK